MRENTTRALIVEAADQLFYRQGFEHTSFADVADVVHISRGNFYHHFKSKDDILDAVIAQRIEQTRAMLACWEQESETPANRIRSFMHMLIANRALITQYGCPVGSLCVELAKLEHPSRTDAAQLFTLFRTWLRRQFELLGRATEADTLAMHLLARSQGVAVLASSFHDEEFLRQEVQQMDDWLDACIGPNPSQNA